MARKNVARASLVRIEWSSPAGLLVFGWKSELILEAMTKAKDRHFLWCLSLSFTLSHRPVV